MSRENAVIEMQLYMRLSMILQQENIKLKLWQKIVTVCGQSRCVLMNINKESIEYEKDNINIHHHDDFAHNKQSIGWNL